MNLSVTFSEGRFTMLPLDVGVVLGALCQPVCEAFPVVLMGVRRTISTRPLSFCPTPSIDSHTISVSFLKILQWFGQMTFYFREMAFKVLGGDLVKRLLGVGVIWP